ncbi:hypothetical protein [Plantibacter sp. M259]|uniref:YczE/YyaS/YitT family protein n=1 Tax=Plantibacter sp. M259 TaxID=2583822 RepID=UPI00197C309F
MTRRVLQLLIGLFLYGIAIAMIVRGAVGVAPWDVLTQGLNLRTGLSFGLITIIVGGLVLLAWIPLKQRPGVGTVLNVLLVGPRPTSGWRSSPRTSTCGRASCCSPAGCSSSASPPASTSAATSAPARGTAS